MDNMEFSLDRELLYPEVHPEVLTSETMGDTALEFGNIFAEDMGVLNNGRVKLGENQIIFKNEKTGKLSTISVSEIDNINWQRLGNKPGIKIALSDGDKWRFGGFKESDFDKIKSFSSRHWQKEIEQTQYTLKGWNHGKAQVDGKYLEFLEDGKAVFEIPLTNVSNCIANKSEATLEFHQNDDCPTSLIEMRFHMPNNADAEEDEDPVEEFRKAVMQWAGIETDSGQPIAALSQILCTTPRGRYDIKIYPNHISLHGKTYDYKIPIKTIMRLFLVPHKDGRHVFFVISLNPPIRQGQTRYHYLVLEFLKEDEIEFELGLTEQQISDQYSNKLQKHMEGPVFEIMSRLFRVLCNMKVTVPGNFVGHSGTPAVQCAHKQASGLLYPLEKGFLYIHKPPMYIRFEEIASVHFARSDGSTRSFDFELELKSGQTLTFNSVEKDEYNKLYDYVEQKHLRIRNAKKMDRRYAEDSFAGSDDELDPYKETVKAEGKERAAESDSDSEDDDYDLDEDLKKRAMEREDNSSAGSGSEPDEEYDSDANSSSGSGEEEADVPKKKAKKDKSSKAKERKPREEKDGKKKKRAKKDPNAPKRALSAYFVWFTEKRSSIKKEGDSVADTSKRAGEMWKKMSDNEKKPFEEKAAKDKERYEKEMKEYKTSGGSTTVAKSSPKKTSGPSPSKAKSKEYISDTDSSDEDHKKKSKQDIKKVESSENSGSDSDD